tara:strand:- start:1799 stop:4372 length:2574 start_codon:yes stop_codon:yes gene_type:complete
MDMKKTKILSAFIIIFILNSCGGGSSAPFELILPSTSAISLNEDNPYTYTISGSTNYKSTIKYEILTSTINGTSELSSTGNYSYIPNQDFFGNDNFTIQLTAERLDNNNVTTGEVLIKTMPISVTVNPVNDPPVVTITDDLVNFSNISLVRDDVINIKVNIVDVDNELSEINFYGQLPSENVNASLDITSDQQSLDLYVSNIQTAGLFNMSLCADDGMDVTCEGDLEAYFISNKDINLVSYNCDENGEQCSSSEQYLYYLVGAPNSTAKTDYLFIADQINDENDNDEFHLRLLESVNNLKNSDAGVMFNDYFNIRVLEETIPSGVSIFNIEKGCYVDWDERIYCIGNVDRDMITNIVGEWDVVSFLTTLDGRGVAQGSLNIQPLSSRSAEIVQHELGHSHGYMGDEYDSRGERTQPTWYADWSVNTTSTTDPNLVKWNHFIEDFDYVPGQDYDVCYNYPDGTIYYRDDMPYEDCECYINQYDPEEYPESVDFPGTNLDNGCKDKIGLFEGTYYDEIDSYRAKWISVMWCCDLNYGEVNVEGFAIGSIMNQGFADHNISSDITDDVDLADSSQIGDSITFKVNATFDETKLKLKWYVDGIERQDLENSLEASFERPSQDEFTSYSWQVEDLTGNLIAYNDPLNPLDFYDAILETQHYYNDDENTNPNNNLNPFVGTWTWHHKNRQEMFDDHIDSEDLNDYLYASLCCSMGASYKINWKNYVPNTTNTNIKASNTNQSLSNNYSKIFNLDLSENDISFNTYKTIKSNNKTIKESRISFRDIYVLTFYDEDKSPIYEVGIGNPFEARIQHIGYENESVFRVDIPIKNFKISVPDQIDPTFISLSKNENNIFEIIKSIKIK